MTNLRLYMVLQESFDTLKNTEYCHVPAVCVTNKTGFGFDDRIYWAVIRLVTTVHISLFDTLSSSSDWTLHWNYSEVQLN
jgi:hypothetical protein